MGRIIAIDYGSKRTGLAATDPLKMIASALDTVPSHEAITYLENYTKTEPVEAFVIGMPKGLDGLETNATSLAKTFIKTQRTLSRPTHTRSRRTLHLQNRRAGHGHGRHEKERPQEKGRSR
jgi:putative Holliday junction resolvase